MTLKFPAKYFFKRGGGWCYTKFINIMVTTIVAAAAAAEEEEEEEI